MSLDDSNQRETAASGQLGETDNFNGDYHNEPGEAAGENTDTTDDLLLHGHYTPTRLHHDLGFKNLDNETMPEEEDQKMKKRKSKRIATVRNKTGPLIQLYLNSPKESLPRAKLNNS